MRFIQNSFAGSLLVTFIFISYSCSDLHNDLINKELITINIESSNDIVVDVYDDIVVQEIYKDNIKSYPGRIKRRGGFSLLYPKHSYELDFTEDITLGNLPSDDDWILNANYIDKTFLRHVISYALFRKMSINNKASNTNFVEVQINGIYNGLYVLMEKLDFSSLDIIRDDPRAFIFKDPHIFRLNYDEVIPENKENFHQQTYPKIVESDRHSYIEDIRHLILNSSDSIFKTSIESVFDIENIIDWNLLLFVSNNADGILKNFYLYKIDSNTQIRVAPWDYDHSFGRDGDNELNLNSFPDLQRSILFSRLLGFQWYRLKLKERWIDLNNKNVLSLPGIMQRIDASAQEVETLVEKNFELWPIDSQWYFDSNNFEDELQIIKSYIQTRHQQLTDYFEII